MHPLVIARHPSIIASLTVKPISGHIPLYSQTTLGPGHNSFNCLTSCMHYYLKKNRTAFFVGQTFDRPMQCTPH